MIGLCLEEKGINIKATCIDIDPEAIQFAAELAKQRDVSSNFHFGIDNVVRICLGGGKIAVPNQELIYSFGLIDYLEDRSVVRILDWIFDTLFPGGTVVLGNLHSNNPNRIFMELIVEWKLIHRSDEEVRNFFSQSKFGQRNVEISRDETGVQQYALCRKS